MTRHVFTAEDLAKAHARGLPAARAVLQADADLRAERVAQLTRAGSSTLAIARRLGCSERTVTRLRRRAGASLGEKAVPYPPEVWAQAERMLADGASRAEVARTLGMSYTTVVAHYPEHAWTPEQVRGHALQAKRLNRL